MKLEAGDKVKVKENLIVGKAYGGQEFVDDMAKFKGRIVEIISANTSSKGYHIYELREDSSKWNWTNEMFEPIKPRICEILGIDIGQKFNIKTWPDNPYYFDLLKDSSRTDDIIFLFNAVGKQPNSGVLIDIINNPSLIEIIPEYTPEQWEVFRAAKLFDKNYIAIDEDGEMYAFEVAPEKATEHDVWVERTNSGSFEITKNSIVYKILKPLLSWEQDEPFEIPEEN